MALALEPRPSKRVLPWILLAAALLGGVALVNGYPLVFSDSGTYIRQALKLEGVLDRPPFYSLFLLPLHLRLSLWFIQDGIVCYVVFRTLSIAFPDLTPPLLALIVSMTGGVTSLPWISNQIMPDIFTPLILLLIFCLCFGWERLALKERVLMPVMLLAMIAFHQASTIFAAMLLGAVLLVAWWHGSPRRAVLRSALLVALPVVLALLGQAFYSYAVIKRFTPSPFGPFFLLARLLDDGPARDYLVNACPAAAYTLCQHQNELRRDSDFLMWSPDSPLRLLNRERGTAGGLDEMAAIVANTVRTYPGAVLLHAASNTAAQLIHIATTDPICPCLRGMKIDQVVVEFFPREHDAYVNSLQNRGTLPWAALTWVHEAVLALSGAFLAVVAMVRRQALAGDAGRLLGLIIWGYLTNAALMGALSGVVDRYQGRLAWLLPLFCLALLVSNQTKPGKLSRCRFTAGRS